VLALHGQTPRAKRGLEANLVLAVIQVTAKANNKT
jgi:hypothetical protein